MYFAISGMGEYYWTVNKASSVATLRGIRILFYNPDFLCVNNKQLNLDILLAPKGSY